MLIAQITWPSGAGIKLNTFCLWPLNETTVAPNERGGEKKGGREISCGAGFLPPVTKATLTKNCARTKRNKRSPRKKFNQFARDMIILCFYLFMVYAFYFIVLLFVVLPFGLGFLCLGP